MSYSWGYNFFSLSCSDGLLALSSLFISVYRCSPEAKLNQIYFIRREYQVSPQRLLCKVCYRARHKRGHRSQRERTFRNLNHKKITIFVSDSSRTEVLFFSHLKGFVERRLDEFLIAFVLVLIFLYALVKILEQHFFAKFWLKSMSQLPLASLHDRHKQRLRKHWCF